MKIKHIRIKNFRGIKTLSWHVKGDFSCLVGPGDTCKTTILTALDYALSPRSSYTFNDSDFFDQDVSHDIVIQVTLTDWDEEQLEIRKFFQERKFAQYKCGLNDDGPIEEPQTGDQVAVSISLRVDKSLEPKWSVVKGVDDQEARDRKPIYAVDRSVLGLSRIDIFSDYHFTWGRNTILTRLSADHENNLNTILSTLAREMRESDISGHQGVQECQAVADAIKEEAQKVGVGLGSISPKIDLNRQPVGSGSLSLHDENVPLRSKGSGSKRLIGSAMQMKLHGGNNIGLIDEIEIGLEPHRIRGLIYKLKSSEQQIFATTHSPVVIRELSVSNDELYVCRRDARGNVKLESLGIVPDIQGQVRANAEAFLGSKIIACEGPTEIGCLRAYDVYRFDENNPPVWSLATSYFNCGGVDRIKPACSQLIQLGYQAAILCDNDAPDKLGEADVQELNGLGAHVCQWGNGNSTELQLFADIPWQNIPELLTKISESHDTIELATIIDNIINEPRVADQNLGIDMSAWAESEELRQAMGDLAHNGKWIKRIDYAAKVFEFALPKFPDSGILKSRLNALWNWIQNNE